MSKVVDLKVVKRERETPQPNPGVIAVLEEALAAAKSGEIEGVILVTNRQGVYDNEVVGGLCNSHAIAECEIAKMQLLDTEIMVRGGFMP